MSRSRYLIDASALTAACARADIVVSDRWLPRTCAPKQLKADGRMLARTGGLSVVLAEPPRIATVASGQGTHAWWSSARR
jgi:competence protein ComEC